MKITEKMKDTFLMILTIPFVFISSIYKNAIEHSKGTTTISGAPSPLTKAVPDIVPFILMEVH